MIINQHNIATSDPRFIFTIDTTKGTGASLTLPLRSGYTYNCTVDWGDNTTSTITAFDDADRVHNYSSGGVYQIKISGIFTAIIFNGGGDRLKLTSIDNWGDVGFTGAGLQAAFSGCSNITSIPDSIPYSGLTNLTDTFRNLAKLVSIPSNLFSKVTSAQLMGNTFYGCSIITSIPANLFDNCTGITSFAGTFYLCTAITSIPTDLFKYNTAATIFNNTFRACYSLGSIPNNLFYYNNLASNYNATFAACRNLSLPASIFNLANLSIVTTFANFMDVDLTSRSPIGTIQDIWNYATSATSTDAFDQCTSLTNYADIPTAWK